MLREVRIGPVVVGGPSVPMIGRLRTWRGRPAAPHEVTHIRARWPGPVVAQPAGADDLARLSDVAEGLFVAAARAHDARLVREAASLRLPVLVQRDPAATPGEWLAIAERYASAGAPGILLCEGGAWDRDGGSRADLGLAAETRARGRWPVAVDPGASPSLATAAVAGGVDALVFDVETPHDIVAHAAESAATVAALVRHARPRSLPDARSAVDQVDACLAILLERRACLAAEIQDLKPVGGFAGRDPVRERAIVEGMAPRAPRLGAGRLERIMGAVIEAGLDLAEAERARGRPDGHGVSARARERSGQRVARGDKDGDDGYREPSTPGRSVLPQSVGEPG